MACFATTWSPNSFQLRLAFNSRTSPVSFSRIRVLKLDRPVRFFSVSCSNATSGNGKELSRVRDSWADSCSSADTFAGWSGANGVERSNNSQRKLSLEGILGAGLAGLILVAGVTFAALSFTGHSTSGKKQEMETLTAHQQMALTSDDLSDRVEEDKNGDKNEMQGNNSLQSKTDTDKNYLHKEYNEATSGETDAEYISNDADVIKNASVQQEDLENEATVDNISVAARATEQLVEPQTSIDSFAASKLEDSKGSFVAIYPEFTTEVTEGFVEAKPTKSNFELNGEYQEGISSTAEMGNSNSMLGSSSNHAADIRLEFPFDSSVNSPSDAALGPFTVPVDVIETTSSISNKDPKPTIPEASDEGSKLSIEMHNRHKDVSSEKTSATHPYADGQDFKSYDDISGGETILDSTNPENFFTSVAIPAPTVIPADVQPFPGKVLVPAVVDQIQGQVLSALQVLKVIEADVQPGDLCTRREYACWLVSASSALSRNTVSKVYPAMYIENVTELAFDDITPEDPDFTSIQGLAEAGLISSKLSRRDMDLSNEDTGPICFFPESSLSRQDLVSWKMALEKRWLPEADRKTMQRLSGFIDIDKINQDAWPAILADLSAGEQGIIALAFGYTRLFQPHKPVTKSQAAVALAIGEGSDIVGEELARIEAECMAEKAVAVHNALVAQVEKDLYASFEEELLLEREKIDAVGKLAEEARRELERLSTEREEDTANLMKERTAIDSEMDVLTKLRHEVEEQLQTLTSNQVEISYEKERVSKLQKDTELENQEIARLHYELEVERKALAMARAWAQDEAKRAREQAKALEEARERWERHGIKVVVDNDLQEEGNAGVTWLTAGKEFSVEETVGRAENLVDKLKAMSADVRGKSRDIINKVIQKILFLVSELKGWTLHVVRRAEEQKDAAMLKISGSLQELQESSAGYTMAIKEIAKRVAGDFKEGVDKLTQKFKS